MFYVVCHLANVFFSDFWNFVFSWQKKMVAWTLNIFDIARIRIIDNQSRLLLSSTSFTLLSRYEKEITHFYRHLLSLSFQSFWSFCNLFDSYSSLNYPSCCTVAVILSFKFSFKMSSHWHKYKILIISF